MRAQDKPGSETVMSGGAHDFMEHRISIRNESVDKTVARGRDNDQGGHLGLREDLRGVEVD